MRAVIQRAVEGKVVVGGEVVGKIDRPGLVVLVGVAHEDTSAQVEILVRKIAELRILSGEQSVQEVGAPVLMISQFTLYGDTRKGRRPSWSHAAPGSVAEPLFNEVVEGLRARGIEVATGIFGADMKVTLTNDGPFTVLVEA